MTAHALIDAFLDAYPQAASGPAHIVVDDLNLEDEHIRWCLGLTKAALSHNPLDLQEPAEDVALMDEMVWYGDHAPDELRATVAVLEALLAIPEAERIHR